MSEHSSPPEHYFSTETNAPSAPKRVTFTFADRQIEMDTDRGVFSYGAIDKGTAVLLRNAPIPPVGTALDLGCGAGALTLAMAISQPQTTVYGIDVSERALQLTKANAQLNSAPNVIVARPETIDPSLRFETIWSNPAIRIGKAALHEMLLQWLNRLTETGQAWLVVQKNLGADSLQKWLGDQGFIATRVASEKGFRVLRVTHVRSG